MKNGLVRELVTVLGLLALFCIALVGINGMVKNFKNPPKIEIVGGDKFSTTESRFTINGVTDPKARITVVKDKIPVDKSGNFSYSMDLKDGEQKVVFVASRMYAQRKMEVSVTKIVELPKSNESTTSSGGAVYAPSQGTTDLATSGPRENIMGAFGLTAIIISLLLYKRSKNKRFCGYRAFTFS